MEQERSYKFIVKEGPNPGEVYTLQKNVIVIGRDPTDSDWWINFTAVSQRHAKVTVVGDDIQIEDLGSSNGTFVNGKKIHTPHVLNSGDDIKLGKSVSFTFVSDAESVSVIASATVVDAPIQKVSDPSVSLEQETQVVSRKASKAPDPVVQKSLRETLA